MNSGSEVVLLQLHRKRNRIDTAQDGTLAAGNMRLFGRLVGGIAHLHDDGGASLVAGVQPGAVDRQVREVEHISRSGRHRRSRLDRVLLRVEMPGALDLMLQWPVLVAAWHKA